MHFKHLRGQHDQRTHGRSGSGTGSGGYTSRLGSSSSQSSFSQQRIVPGRISTALGIVSPIGLPSMKRVEVGENGISTLDDAAQALYENKELSSIPDDFLLDAMEMSRRFKRSTLWGKEGINGAPTVLTDKYRTWSSKNSGEVPLRYFVKFRDNSSQPNEDIAEMLGNNLSGRIGFPVGSIRSAQNDTRSVTRKPIILEHIDNYFDVGPDKADENIFALQDTLKMPIPDRVNALIFDYLMLNLDRHSGNFFGISPGDSSLRYAPIDSSLAFSNPILRDNGANEGGFRQFAKYTVMQNYFMESLTENFVQDNRDEDGDVRREISRTIQETQRRLQAYEKRIPFKDEALLALDALKIRDGDDPNDWSSRLSGFWRAEYPLFVTDPSERIQFFTQQDPDDIANMILDR